MLYDQSLLISAIGWVEIKLDLKRSVSEQKSTIYVVNIVKKRKTGMSSLEAGADAGLQKIKEEFIADESETVAPRTQSEEHKTAMSKHVKALTSVCSIHVLNSKHLVEEHELAVGQDLTGKVNLVLAGSPCNVQRN